MDQLKSRTDVDLRTNPFLYSIILLLSSDFELLDFHSFRLFILGNVLWIVSIGFILIRFRKGYSLV